MPFLDQQSLRRHLLHTSRVFQRFASEIKFGPWCCEPGRKPYWPSSYSNSTNSQHFVSRHLAYIVPGWLRSDIPRYFVHSLRSSFLYIGMITPVCQLLVFFQVSTPPDTTLSTNVSLFLLMPLTFQIGFCFH